jgi:hypothetical protein
VARLSARLGPESFGPIPAVLAKDPVPRNPQARTNANSDRPLKENDWIRDVESLLDPECPHSSQAGQNCRRDDAD